MSIIEKLKKLQTFYCTLTGQTLDVKDIIFTTPGNISIYGGEHVLNECGKMYSGGECLIFPSKENRDWETIKISKFSQFEPVMCSSKESKEFFLRYHTGNISSDGYNRYTNAGSRHQCMKIGFGAGLYKSENIKKNLRGKYG